MSFVLVNESFEYNAFLRRALTYIWRYLRLEVMEKDPRIKNAWNQVKDSKIMEEWGWV